MMNIELHTTLANCSDTLVQMAKLIVGVHFQLGDIAQTVAARGAAARGAAADPARTAASAFLDSAAPRGRFSCESFSASPLSNTS